MQALDLLIPSRLELGLAITLNTKTIYKNVRQRRPQDLKNISICGSSLMTAVPEGKGKYIM